MNQILKQKYPYLSKFFETAIEQKRLFHSIILYGNNNYIQYAMAMEIARILNCSGDKTENCCCQNCKWIRENKHPAVTTISKIDNKTDSSKTVISEEQINTVLDTLINSSDFHRVFILCDAEMKQLSQGEKKEYEEFKLTDFSLPQESDGERIWRPSGINTSCFSTVAANSMLKSIEEPPSNVTFIFLTNNKDDLLQTIVSRSESFYVSDAKNITYDTSFFENFFSCYPKFDKKFVLDFSRTLLNYQTENNLNPQYILDCLQYYFCELAKANFENKFLLQKIYKDIQKTEESKKMLNAYIKEQTVFEDLAFYFAR